MKAIITLILTIASLSSFAKEIKVFEFESSRRYEVEAYFSKNEELNRVWITVEKERVNRDWGADYHRVKLPELKLNSAQREVVYILDGEEISCGSFSYSRWLGADKFIETGRCSLSTRKFVKKVDDGFNIKNVKMTEVLLTVE